jgi:hypothetical protein
VAIVSDWNPYRFSGIERSVSEYAADMVVSAAGAYVAAGVLFAVAFVTRGVSRMDHVARQGTPGFRLIILPGTVALWPLLAARWLRSRS